MSNWKELYESRRMSAGEAAAHIRSGDRVVVAHGPAAPLPVLQALADNKENYTDVTFYHMAIHVDTPYVGAGMAGHFRLNTGFVAPEYRGLLEEGLVDFTPFHFSEMSGWLENDIKSNVVLVVTTPPDEKGYVCCGLSCDYTIPSARRARTIIAEVNPNCPTVYGDTFIHVSDIECFVETNRQLPGQKPGQPTEEERKLGGYCAELVGDGSTLQLGTGKIPDAVLPYLMDKKDLGIHSEIIGDGVRTLMEAGVITGQRKSINKGLVVTASVFGSSTLHRYVDRHPAMALRPIHYTNDVRIISRNDNMVSINTCIQVDLFGQVNSEFLGGRQFSGIGGQVDFIRGAKMSKGGKSIIACLATAKNGAISKIVANLEPGAPVTASRDDVDYVVTEYGIAHLTGRTLKERGLALIKVAHPNFRDELTEELKKRYK